jgi:hypothetical protein
VTEVLLCVVGAFYAFAGYVATRAALTSHFLDRAIAAIACKKPSSAEVRLTYWLLSAATLVLAGGVALAFLLDVAPWLFVASAAGQALYLFVLAPRYFDVEDPPDPRGRQQSTNAFVVYLAATAFVVWAAATDKLVTWQDLGWLLAVPATAVAAHLAYIVWTLAGSRSVKAPSLFGGEPPDDVQDQDYDAIVRERALSKRIKLMADYDSHPLWALDEDIYGDVPPEHLGLSPELTRDLNAWAEAYSSSLNRENPAESLWSDEQFAAHEAMARPLAVRLARERPDLMIYVMDRDVGVVEVHGDDEPPRAGGAGL